MVWTAEDPLLELGRTYAWKAIAVVEGDWQASEYVPFHVLDSDVVNDSLDPVAGRFLQPSREGQDLRGDGKATETRLKNEASRYRLLHLATHGLVSDAHPMISGVLLAANAGMTACYKLTK